MATTIGSLDLNAFSDLYSDSTQYFWFESNASATYGAGAHVTLVPDASFISNPTGQNILMNTDGFSIRNGLLPMMTLDNDSLDFNVVDTTAGTYTTTATFTATGAQIGQSSGAHSIIDADGQRFYASDGTTQLANIGYGVGQAQSGTDVAPYYTFGTRASGSVVGNYSIAEGFDTTASNYASHAEGEQTTASGYASHAEGVGTASGSTSHAEGSGTASGATSHAEGSNTTASGSASHAEGVGTTASGASSHAEGDDTTASGVASHAEGSGTISSKRAQTALGSFNEEDTSSTTTHPSGIVSYGQYSVIIGNGTSSNPSNALTVDWAGNVDAAGTLRAKTEQLAPTISRITGTTVRYRIRRFGNVVTLYFTVRNTESTAVGGYIYQANISGIPLPADWATTAVYYGGRPLVVSFSYTGLLSLRNTYSAAFAMGASDSVSFSITYVID